MAEVTVFNYTPTLAELRDDIYFLTGENSDTFPTSRVTRVLNEALTKVWKQTHLELDVAYTTFHTSLYSTRLHDAMLAGGYAIVMDVFISGGTDDVESTALSAVGFALEDTAADMAIPTSYAIEGNTIYLYPTPDQDYTVTVRYRREFTPLVLDTDTTHMSDDEIRAATYYCAWVMKTADEELESAAAFRSMYLMLIADLLAQETGLFPPEQGAYYGGAY